MLSWRSLGKACSVSKDLGPTKLTSRTTSPPQGAVPTSTQAPSHRKLFYVLPHPCVFQLVVPGLLFRVHLSKEKLLPSYLCIPRAQQT